MTVRELLTTLQRLSKDAELVAFGPGCEDYCEREVDELEWLGGRGLPAPPAPAATIRPGHDSA